MKTAITAAFLALTCLFVPSAAWAEVPYQVEWIQQIGTSSDDWSYSVALDDLGNAYISGYTYGGLEGTNPGGWDAFLVKFSEGSAIPEPSTLLLGVMMSVGLLGTRRRLR